MNLLGDQADPLTRWQAEAALRTETEQRQRRSEERERHREVAEFAEHVKRCVGFAGRIIYDRTRADGTPRKLLDCGRFQALGWSAMTSLEEGLRLYYDWFLSNQPHARAAGARLALPHSITSSARASSVGGKVSPRILAA